MVKVLFACGVFTYLQEPLTVLLEDAQNFRHGISGQNSSLMFSETIEKL
jgi:hypothetical protein